MYYFQRKSCEPTTSKLSAEATNDSAPNETFEIGIAMYPLYPFVN